MKIRNMNYKEFKSLPIELELRNVLSFQFNSNDIDGLKKFICSQTKIEIDNSMFSNIFKDKFY